MRSAFGVDHGEIRKDYAAARQKQANKPMSVTGNTVGMAGAGLIGATASDASRGVKMANQTIKQMRAPKAGLAGGKTIPGRTIKPLAAGAGRVGGALGGAAGGLRARPGVAIGAIGGGAILGHAMARAHNKQIGKGLTGWEKR